MSCEDNKAREWLGQKIGEVDLGNGVTLNTYYPHSVESIAQKLEMKISEKKRNFIALLPSWKENQ